MSKSKIPGQDVEPMTGEPAERIGLFGWMILYASGAILFFFLMVHILSVHFLSPERMGAETVFDHYRSWFLIFISFGLLVFGVLHGMVGLRRVLLDLDLFSRRGDRIFSSALAVIGAVVIIVGVVIFDSFVTRM